MAVAQGTFQNLNFEEANPQLGGSAAALFPGWQVFYGSNPAFSVGYDTYSLAAPFLAVIDSSGGNVIQGSYSALFQSDLGTSVSISQMGLVPSGTESIQFDASEENSGSFEVTLGSDNITMFPLRNVSGYTVYGGNISAWGGQGATLSITQLAPANSGPQFQPSFLELDAITFSPVAVTPEPSPLVLAAIGTLFFGAYQRFARKAQ